MTGPAQTSCDVLDIIEKIATIVAIFVGGVWAYINYLRGRTFKRRLEPSITAKTFRAKGLLVLSGTAQLKNVGLSKVTIRQEGTAIEVVAITDKPGEEAANRLGTKDIAVLSVFERHGWIEPGEPIGESFLVPVPQDDDILAFRIRLRVVSEGIFSQKIEWNCDSVADLPAPSDAEEFWTQLKVTKEGSTTNKREARAMDKQQREDTSRTEELERRKREERQIQEDKKETERLEQAKKKSK